MKAPTAVIHDASSWTAHDVLRNRCRRRASPTPPAQQSPRQEQARQTARAGRAAGVRVGEVLAARDAARGRSRTLTHALLTRAILGLYNSIWQWYRPAGTYRPAADLGVLQRPRHRDDGPQARRRDPTPDGGMTFFERYFERLDGDDPHSALDLVAENREFSISGPPGGPQDGSSSAGRELRGFTEAGDTSGGRTTCRWSGTKGDVEVALGETRRDESGERIGTFLAVANSTRRAYVPVHGRAHARAEFPEDGDARPVHPFLARRRRAPRRDCGGACGSSARSAAAAAR